MDSADRNPGSGNGGQQGRPQEHPRPVVSQRTYWIRRAVALLILVAVGTLAVWGAKAVIGLFTGDSKDPGGQSMAPKDAPETPAAESGDKADDQADDQAADNADDKVADKETDAGPQACDPGNLSFALTAANTQFSAAKTNTFSVETTFTGTDPCTLDVGLAARPVTVFSGEDRIWSSADCDEKGARMLLLSKDVKDTAAIEWNMARSDEKCTPDLAVAKSGTYRAVLEVAGIETEPYVFNVVP